MPYIIWSGVFVVLPIFLVIYYSLSVETGGQLIFSVDNYKRVFDTVYLTVFQRSITLALLCTAVCILLGYPIAYVLASNEYVNRGFLMFMFLIPMWMNMLLRSYSWVTILERNGLINTMLEFMGLPKMSLLYNRSAVLLGMVHNFLPFMILPIYSILKKRDQSLIEAAQDLGANPRQVFLRLTLPLSIPGVISGITMVFMPAATTFIISDLLGGAQYMMLGTLIEQQFLKVNDWHFGSAVSVILLILLLVSYWIFSMVDRSGEDGVLF